MVDIVEISPTINDNWYKDLCGRVQKTPEHYPQWKIEDNLLYKHAPLQVPLQTNFTEWKLLVPKEKCQEVISSCHDPPTDGHLGFMKTFARVAKNYYWSRMRRDILSYVK
jgi:hypothetical protein